MANDAQAHMLRRRSRLPTDARLTHSAIEKCQSYRRVAKRAAIMVGRYTHAQQFKRASSS